MDSGIFLSLEIFELIEPSLQHHNAKKVLFIFISIFQTPIFLQVPIKNHNHFQ